MEGGSDLELVKEEAKVELPHVTVEVAESVGVVLHEEVLKHTTLGHEAEEVMVATEKYVELQKDEGQGENCDSRSLFVSDLPPFQCGFHPCRCMMQPCLRSTAYPHRYPHRILGREAQQLWIGLQDPHQQSRP